MTPKVMKTAAATSFMILSGTILPIIPPKTTAITVVSIRALEAPRKTDNGALLREAKAKAESWVLSPSSARKMIKKLDTKICQSNIMTVIITGRLCFGKPGGALSSMVQAGIMRTMQSKQKMPGGPNETDMPKKQSVTVSDFDRRIAEWLHLEEFAAADDSQNGLQVANATGRLKRVAFAVDACLESFRRAREWKADLLFVHHGLFWGRPLPVTKSHYQRLKALLASDCALYAVHLPLDAHPELGNNAGIAALLGLEQIESFGLYKGLKIGIKGRLPEPMSLVDLQRILSSGQNQGLSSLPFGPERIRSVGIVSGGGASIAMQAVDENLDLFVTGESSHTIYHPCLEAGLHVLFGGHYLTEVWGVKRMCEKVREEMGLETVFLDLPTGY
jgi:dinuclear metal center YbgI/SA1388 family protein